MIKSYGREDTKSTLDKLKARITKNACGVKRKKSRIVRTVGPKTSCCCPDCGKRFISPYYLNLHLRNSGQKEACATCGTVLTRGAELKAHLVSVHNETVFACEDCPSLFASERDLKGHKKKSHVPGVWCCGDCGRVFPRETSFDSHAQMHAVRICRSCDKQFTNRSCYRQHRSTCEPDAKGIKVDLPRMKRSNIRDKATYTCDYCGKSYLSRPQLKNHIIWIHMDVRPHQCQWCGKRFYTSARLAEHTVVHTRERNFECDICGAKLVSKMAAVYHRRRHTGEKPYECADCGDKFISASRRTQHARRRHGYGERIPCEHCPATFVRMCEMKKHAQKNHTAELRTVKIVGFLR